MPLKDFFFSSIASQVPTLGAQLNVGKQMKEAYRLATENQPYSYLVADFTDRSDPQAWKYSLRSNIFPSDPGYTHVFGRK